MTLRYRALPVFVAALARRCCCGVSAFDLRSRYVDLLPRARSQTCRARYYPAALYVRSCALRREFVALRVRSAVTFAPILGAFVGFLPHIVRSLRLPLLPATRAAAFCALLGTAAFARCCRYVRCISFSVDLPLFCRVVLPAAIRCCCCWVMPRFTCAVMLIVAVILCVVAALYLCSLPVVRCRCYRYLRVDAIRSFVAYVT